MADMKVTMTLNGYLQTISNKIFTLLAIKKHSFNIKTILLALLNRNQHNTFHNVVW